MFYSSVAFGILLFVFYFIWADKLEFIDETNWRPLYIPNRSLMQGEEKTDSQTELKSKTKRREQKANWTCLALNSSRQAGEKRINPNVRRPWQSLMQR